MTTIRNQYWNLRFFQKVSIENKKSSYFHNFGRIWLVNELVLISLALIWYKQSAIQSNNSIESYAEHELLPKRQIDSSFLILKVGQSFRGLPWAENEQKIPAGVDIGKTNFWAVFPDGPADVIRDRQPPACFLKRALVEIYIQPEYEQEMQGLILMWRRITKY